MGKPARVIISPKQSLGQNFLIDDNIARNIVRDLHLAHEDTVVEIGPGQGALTKHLVGKAQHVIAVEIDHRVIENLWKQFIASDVSILHQNFLEIPLREISEQYKRKLRIVGNIPYHLTSPILFKVFDEHEVIQDLTMTVQREVAQRIVAKRETKEYGILSVFSQFYGTPRLLFNVSPNCFYPKPKVTSTVIQLVIRETLPIDVDTNLFGTIVRTTFGKRRKTLCNSLKYLPYDEHAVQRIISGVTLSLDRRPEQLTVEDFITLTKDIQHIIA